MHVCKIDTLIHSYIHIHVLFAYLSTWLGFTHMYPPPHMTCILLLMCCLPICPP